MRVRLDLFTGLLGFCCMARLPRYFAPNCPQHLILRGNNREPVFA